MAQSSEPFEVMLSGGHQNSLGRTEEVVDLVLKGKNRLEELYQCYFSDDEVVRLRVSSSMKRVAKEQPAWVYEYLDQLIETVSKIKQASVQWTIAELFDILKKLMTKEQRSGALKVMKKNLDTWDDWIVLNQTMQVLFEWSVGDDKLQKWLEPRLIKLTKDKRGSVSRRAAKLLGQLN